MKAAQKHTMLFVPDIALDNDVNLFSAHILYLKSNYKWL